MNVDALPSLPPILDLGEYVLRGLRPDDADAWFSYLSDPEVTRQTSYNVTAIDDVSGMIDHYIAGYHHRRSCRWALARSDNDLLVGTCGFYHWDMTSATAELGYDLSRACWGTGIMTRAVRAVVQWSFDKLHARRIQATVMVGNVASARVLEKCGFNCEQTLPNYRICRGQACDFWMFGCHSHDHVADRQEPRARL